MTGGSSDVDSFPSSCNSKTAWLEKEEKWIKYAGQNVKLNSHYTQYDVFLWNN